MIKKVSVIEKLRIWGVVTIIGIVAIFIILGTVTSINEFNFHAEQLQKNYIKHQKQTIKDKVNSVVEKIIYAKGLREKLTKKRIKTRVYEAYAIAQNIYEQNKSSKSKPEIKKMIVDALRPIRYSNGIGYFFITQFNGVEILFADRPELEGKNLINLKDSRGKFVIKDMIKIAKEKGEGYCEYYWTKPNHKGGTFQKLSFIKKFGPYNWFIGTGLYVKDIEKIIKKELFTEISQIRFGDKNDGYIFVVSYDGVTLVNDTQKHLIGKNIWHLTDPNGVKVIQEERRAVKNPDGGFIYYSWNKPSVNKIFRKVSFIKGVAEWKWMIGSGIYIEDIETKISLLKKQLNQRIVSRTIYSFIILILVITFFYYLLYRIGSKFNNDFRHILSFIKKASHSNETIDRKAIRFIEFDQLAQDTNKMLVDKIDAEKKRKEIQEQLFHSSKLAAIGELSAGIAHEINNPLAIVNGYIEILESYLASTAIIDTKYKNYIDKQKDGIDRIKNIVDGLRVYARVEKENKENFSVNDLIERSINLVKNVYEKNNNIIIKQFLQKEELFIHGNKGRFQQILINLLSNANDSMSDNNGGSIEIKTKGTEEHVMISIADQGTGISKENEGKIFDPFFTTKEIGKGTGIGLSIVASLINELDGKIDITSKESEGTVITMIIPRCEAIREDVSAVEELENDYEKIEGNALIVDDEKDLRKIMRVFFEEFGFSVEEAENGEEALEKVKQGQFDVVVTDIKMPKMRGDQLVKEMANAGYLDKISVFVITGDIDKNIFSKDSFLNKIDIGIIVKPFSKESIYQKLKEIYIPRIKQ